jgi:peptidyl-prolyl cis-trans isomerase D
MFDFFRKHTRVLQFLLLLVIFPSFVVIGVQGYDKYREGSGTEVAKVNGDSIKQAELDTANQRQIERMRRQMPNVDVKLLDTPQMRQQTLDALVRERVLLVAAQKLHLAVSDERLLRAFSTDPQFAFLRNPDNSINKDILAAQGMSSELFAQQLRQELSARQVLQGVAASALAPMAVAKTGLDALLQQREVQLQTFDAKDYRSRVKPSDAELEAFYKNPANEARFRAPEQASIEYVVLDLARLKKDVVVSQDELKQYYEQNIARYTTAEERQASHILVKAEKDAPAADRAKAKARAEALLAEVRKNPAAFADLARKNSDDPGSKDQGGDLGFFSRDAMVKPFSDAAFAMKPGEISGLVQSDFGYHIIRLAALRGGEKKPFDAVRADIEEEKKKQVAQQRYAEAAEQFSNLVYEQSDTLQPVIDKLKLDKQTATVQRAPVASDKGPLSSPKFIEAVFGNDALRNKRNTEAIEFGPNQLAAARVVQYTPARLLPLAEVKDRVREQLVAVQAAAAARKDGEARLAQLKQSGDASGLGAPVLVSRLKAETLPRPVVDAALRADASRLPVIVGADLGEQGFAVVRVSRVQAPEAGELKSLQPRYGDAWAAAEAQAYYAALKTRYKVQIKNPPAVVDAAASAAAR